MDMKKAKCTLTEAKMAPCSDLSPGMTHDQHTDLTIHRLQLLESGNDKDSSLPHATLGLADNIHAQDSLGDTKSIHCFEMIDPLYKKKKIHNAKSSTRNVTRQTAI